MNVAIRLLSGQWFYDDEAPLGPPGGFGEVFAGTNLDGRPVAVKRLKIGAREAAHRELRVAAELAGRELQHVVPILDAGIDAETDSYFVVMARADRSLQQELERRGPVPDVEAAEILLQIAQGLAEASEVVHRDLKPGNVLWHDGAWKLADFGIARFVEAATSLRTLRDCLSPPYAAPEQWTGDRATGATDVYALGCVGHTLLTGRPPFLGPAREDFQEQHLRGEPLPLDGHAPRLRSLLSIMLRKTPAARPLLPRVLDLLQRLADDGGADEGGQGLGALAQAGAHVAEREAAEEAVQQRVRTEQKERVALAREAMGSLRAIAGQLQQSILEAVPAAQAAGRYGVAVGDASLEVQIHDQRAPLAADAFRETGWDVVAGATIRVHQTGRPYVWSSSFWYADRRNGAGYRWYEISYFALGSRSSDEPFALSEPREADLASAPVTHVYCVAWGPQPIDDEDAGPFCDRWAAILAKASRGQLRHPSRLPLSDQDWYRD